MVADNMTYGMYFVWKKPLPDHTYQVVRREVRARTRKGYPISYELKSIPGEFESWERAQAMAEEFNRQWDCGAVNPWLEIEEGRID